MINVFLPILVGYQGLIVMEIVFATSNQNKAAEIQKMLPDSIQVKTLSDIGCTEEIPETRDTVAGNASQKSEYVVENYGMSCFADDTALEIDALDGRPGVYSARYAGPQKSAEDNMTKILSEMEGIVDRTARFRTVISLLLNGEEHLFEGIVEGTIRTERSGTEGFGYDPIFEPTGFDITFSEMSMEEKNKISHRGKAVRALIDFLINISD